MSTKNRIVIISSGQPSANPRVVKEATALLSAGYQVTVIYSPLSPWADVLDKELFKKFPGIKWISAGFHPTNNELFYTYSRLRKKIYDKLFSWFANVFNIADYSYALFGQEILKEAYKHKAQLYIGHNLAALPAVIKVSKKYAAKSAFDAEDFHRGEAKQESKHWKNAAAIENKYLLYVNYLSAASPLIAKEYSKLFPHLQISTINNVFPSSLLQGKPEFTDIRELKLFWFSQTIGPGRGIEDVIEAIALLNNNKIHLSLLGNISETNKQYFLSLIDKGNIERERVKFIHPVSEIEIAAIASQHHIGLALEVPDCISRDLCLTNKIFFYLLAANAIIFSNTKAQKKFLEEYSGVGYVYESGNATEISKIISHYLSKPQTLFEHRLNSWHMAKDKLNWERESNFFLESVKEVLKN